MSWYVPAAEFESEYTVKKSRFIARVVPVSDRAAVNTAVARARRDYPDARHHCWAYLLGDPRDAANAGMSDDGEPAGTAGRPILNVLQHGRFGDVLVVVSRYFGGIKLGAGGLVRAYGTATQQALDGAPATERVDRLSCRLLSDFSCEQGLRHTLQGLGGEVCRVQYTEQVSMEVSLPRDKLPDLTAYCAAHHIQLTKFRGQFT